MAGWSILKDGSDLNDHEILQTCKSKNGSYFDLQTLKNVDDCNERLRTLFDQVLVEYLKEVGGEKYIRPIPALLGDGQPADLFKLFWAVWKRGGYNSVSRNGLWALVAKECGLDSGVLASLKLVYMKYLSELDNRVRAVFKDEMWESGECEVCGKLGLSLKLQKEFRELLCGEEDLRKIDYRLNEPEKRKNGKFKLLYPAARDVSELGVHIEKVIDHDEKFCINSKKKATTLQVSCGEQVSTTLKRKRGSPSLPQMLNWIIEAAKHSDDPSIGKVPECSKWKKCGNEEFWAQALLAREVLLTKPHVDSNIEESLLQKKLKMHPSMYEDGVNHQSTERLRCSERLPSLTKHRFCPCCNSSSASHSKVVTSPRAKVEDNPKEEAPASMERLGTNENESVDPEELVRKHVSVGFLFQAEVPAWTGVVAESDSKWLGMRMWPLENEKHKFHGGMDPIGKGRENSCECQFPGSVKCIRFHIAEKRMKLKHELGLLFYHWRFDRMGEEISLSWTIEEEKRYKDLVRLKPPSLHKSFWANIFKFFPRKTKDQLVSYYFNVFLIKRRIYQNRVTPTDIDSDDDEKEFGSVGDRYGCETLINPAPKLPPCVENKQCFELYDI
ncbi:hypothetical protein NMG60_11027075 [Bertholletia excelsa]